MTMQIFLKEQQLLSTHNANNFVWKSISAILTEMEKEKRVAGSSYCKHSLAHMHTHIHLKNQQFQKWCANPGPKVMR